MHFPVASICFLALGVKTSLGFPAPPNGYSAQVSTFIHTDCKYESQGLYSFGDDMTDICLNMRDSALSVKYRSLKEGCRRKLINCRFLVDL